MKKLFITGNDTDVGKTYVGSLLVSALINAGYSCIPRKPIETGCKDEDGELIPGDATIYHYACNQKESLDLICPYRYKPPISPERAIRLAGETIAAKDVFDSCIPKNEADFLLVEGAGGFYSPLCTDGLNADLAELFDGKVILVIKDRLGCINQTLLTMAAIAQSKLDTLAVVLNQYRKHEELAMDNFEDLSNRLELPVIPIPDLSETNQTVLDLQQKSISELLNIITDQLVSHA